MRYPGLESNLWQAGAVGVLLIAGTAVAAGQIAFREPALTGDSPALRFAATSGDRFADVAARSSAEFLDRYTAISAPSFEVTVDPLADRLPDAPEPQQAGEKQLTGMIPPRDPTSASPPVAKRRARYIPAGYAYQHLDAGDKVYIAFANLATVGNLGGILISAGYSHLTNSAPRYGTNREAFAQRVGAAAARGASEGIFTDAIFSNVFHQDPRFFVEGPNHPLGRRIAHGASRVIITRNDDGSHRFNYSLWTGYAASTALTVAYYPDENREAKNVITRYFTSIAGQALVYLWDEFSPQVLEGVHLKKKQ